MSQNHSPLVSIIIPCYKAERELPDALRSVSQQTYSHWEIIAILDGWKDNSHSILKKFELEHPNNAIKVIEHPQNRGLACSRDSGMNASQGDLVAFLDHDDFWESNHLETAITLLKSSSADIYFTPIVYMDQNAKPLEYIWGPTPEDLNKFADSLFSRNFIAPSGVVLSKSLIQKLGPMDKNVKGCEDHDYWLRSLNLGATFCNSETPTVRYRVNNPNAMTTNVTAMLEMDLRVQKKHYSAPLYTKKAKRKSISRTYELISNSLWMKDHSKSLKNLISAILWCPTHFHILRRLLKGTLLWPKQVIDQIQRQAKNQIPKGYKNT